MPSTFNNPALSKIINGVATDPNMPFPTPSSYFNVHLFSSAPWDQGSQFYSAGMFGYTDPTLLPGWVDLTINSPSTFQESVPGALFNTGYIIWSNPNPSDVTITHILLERSDQFGANSSTWIALALETPVVVPANDAAPFQKWPTQISFKVSNS